MINITLRYDSETHSDSSNEVGDSITDIVAREPGEEGETWDHVAETFVAGTLATSQVTTVQSRDQSVSW